MHALHTFTLGRCNDRLLGPFLRPFRATVASRVGSLTARLKFVGREIRRCAWFLGVFTILVSCIPIRLMSNTYTRYGCRPSSACLAFFDDRGMLTFASCLSPATPSSFFFTCPHHRNMDTSGSQGVQTIPGLDTALFLVCFHLRHGFRACWAFFHPCTRSTRCASE